MHKPYTDVQRANALKRAKKFEKLFRAPLFDDIVAAAEAHDEGSYKKAIEPAKLVDSEVTWLWNYLKQCDMTYWKPVPEAEAAANTGW